jgi:hypothetical protein
MPNPSLPSRPYLEFAERCQKDLDLLGHLYDSTVDVSVLPSARTLQQAERHARLLETIAQEVALTENLSLISDPYSRGVATAHAHIRSLLEQG